VGILVQVALPGFARIDGRIWMRQYETAIRAVRERIPEAQIVLRPHPSEGLGAARVVTERFPGELEIDGASPILDYLESCDLCIGGVTAATLQAALVGTPVIALNLTGFDWRWPLGGETTVPIARSPEELGDALDRWRAEGVLPGREALLDALGADGGDGPGRFLAVLEAAR
jgi:ADP-heptose:LPS heptosyltransferase